MALPVTEATVGRERWRQLAGRGGLKNRDTARACWHQGLFAFQVSTSLELSFVARDKIEKLKPGEGIRNDVPVTEAEGPGLEKMSKKAEKKSAALSG